jgi:CBS domain-containing protein
VKVRDVLRQKDSGDVVMGRAADSVLDAARTLAQYRVGVVVIVDGDRRIRGTLSEADVVRGVGETGPGFLACEVGTVMNHHFSTCSLEDDVHKVMTTITRTRQRQLPVVDDEIVVGVISIGDVMKSLLESTELENRVLRDFYRTHH